MTEQEKRVAESFKDVLITVDGIKTIKEINFSDHYFNIGFATKASAIEAQKCNRLSKYQYDSMPKGFKYRHRLIGHA